MPRYDDRSARYDDRSARHDDRSARYDDRSANSTRLYVGHLSSRTRSRDLEHIFSRYGRVRDVDMKHDYAFVDFSHYRDADNARHSLDGREVDGRRMIVEFAKGVPRGPGGVREYVGKGPPPGSGRCFNCGLDGHWARDCKAGDWKNKCYRCGERGHIEKNCQNSPQKTSHGRSYSRSPVRSRSPRRRRTPSGSYIRSRSYSRSRSPPRRKRVAEQERTSRSPRQSYSPEPGKDSSPSRTRKRSLTPDDDIPQKSPASKRGASFERKEDEFSQSPEERNRSPLSPNGGGDKPALKRYDESPYETNERGQSGSPVGDRSPVDDYGVGDD